MIPSSTVAAMTPNANAARSPDLSRLVSMTLSLRVFVRASLLLWASLGLAACTETTAPVRRFPILDDSGGSDWQFVSSGGDHTCAIKANGNAYCWGSNRYGQLGVAVGDTVCGAGTSQFRCSPAPMQVQPGVKFTSISAGARHTCALTTAREAYCWGANDDGQVGEFSSGGPVLVRVPGALPWSQVSAGFSHSCAVRTDGALYCWGANDRGQLGNGTVVGGVGPVHVPIPAPVASVSAGQQRTCARTTTGTVYCWGAVWVQRQNGLEFTRSQTTPQLVPGAPAMAWVSVGSFTTCGADRSGFAYCWEGNPRGEIGNGTTDGSTTPLRVASDLEFLQVSAGIVQSCGVVTSGAAYCWGDNSFGQLGVSNAVLVERCGAQNLPCSTKPVEVVGRQQFTEVSTGFGSHTCGVTTRGNLYCWGLDASGQRGDGATGAASALPATVVEPR
jgi:alpha-tubulin suppressor-like RCC1 family protein